MTPEPAPNLLRAVHALGEQMCAALRDDDLDAFFGFVEQRTALLEQLQAYTHPSEVDPEWETTATALAAQHDVLTAALAGQERRMSEALRALERFKDARHRYGAQPNPRPGILGRHFHG